jgi:hypothetical protein
VYVAHLLTLTRWPHNSNLFGPCDTWRTCDDVRENTSLSPPPCWREHVTPVASTSGAPNQRAPGGGVIQSWPSSLLLRANSPFFIFHSRCSSTTSKYVELRRVSLFLSQRVDRLYTPNGCNLFSTLSTVWRGLDTVTPPPARHTCRAFRDPLVTCDFIELP